jgi:hypothetical protein
MTPGHQATGDSNVRVQIAIGAKRCEDNALLHNEIGLLRGEHDSLIEQKGDGHVY